MPDAANQQSHSVSQKIGKNTTSQWPTKQPRADPQEAMSIIIMNQASTATITTTTKELVNRNHNFLTSSPITIHNTNGLALKPISVKKNLPAMNEWIGVTNQQAEMINLT